MPHQRFQRFDCHVVKNSLILPQMTNSGLFQTKRIADDNSKFDENGEKFSKRKGEIVEKGNIACYRHFLFFLEFSAWVCLRELMVIEILPFIMLYHI